MALSSTCEKVIAGDVTELLYGERIPARGLVLKDGLLYDDGALLGIPTREVWTVGRGETVEFTYRPIAEIVAELPDDPEPGPAESGGVDCCSYPRHRPMDWTVEGMAGRIVCGVCHPPAVVEGLVRRGEPRFDELTSELEGRVDGV